MPAWSQIVGVFSILGTIIAATFKITRTLNLIDRRIASRLERLELRIASVEAQNKALLKTFPRVIAGLMNYKIMTVQEGTSLIADSLESAPMADLLRDIKPTVNPLSQLDVDRLRQYVEWVKQNRQLTPDQARDFYRIADIVTHEYPSNEAAWLLFLIGGILLGLILADAKK